MTHHITEQNRTELTEPAGDLVLDNVMQWWCAAPDTEMTRVMMFAVMACSCILVHAAPESDRIIKLPGLAGDVAPTQ